MLREFGLRKLDARFDPNQLAAWLTATASGDRQAFRLLYDTTSPRLYALLRGMLRTEDGAQDALQDTFFKVWQKAGSYCPERGGALPWLMSIARYRALDLLRRKRPEVALPEDPEFAETLMVDRTGSGPHEDQATGEFLESLKSGLETLDANHKRALLLAYYHGLTHAELSRELDAPLGTVKSWIRRGLTRLLEQ